MSKRQAKRWTVEETKALLHFYKARKHELSNHRKKRLAYARIVEDMVSAGFDPNIEVAHLEVKIATLTRAYKAAKDNGKCSGDFPCPPFMNEMEEIFGDRPIPSESDSFNAGAECLFTTTKPTKKKHTNGSVYTIQCQNESYIELKPSSSTASDPLHNQHQWACAEDSQSVSVKNYTSAEEDYELFGAFIASELRALAKNQSLIRSVKKKIQLTIIEAYETYEAQCSRETSTQTENVILQKPHSQPSRFDDFEMKTELTDHEYGQYST